MHAADVAAAAAANLGEKEESQVFAEDRFHRDDILSQHYIGQRDATTKEKVEQQKKKDEDRANGVVEDGVEYLDLDDFRPGGKFCKDGEVAALPPLSELTDVAPPPEPARPAADVLDSRPAGLDLQSDLWAELL